MRGHIAGQQTYFLEVPGARSAEASSVVSFTAVERLGDPYAVTVQLTHPLELARADYLGKPATFLIDPADGTEPRKFAGCITQFSQTSQTHDFHGYEIVVEPLVARLRLTRASRIYQHKTAPEIIEAILRRHELVGHQFAFKLRRPYPQHKFRFQYQLSDWDYIRLLMEQEGIYSYFVHGKFGEMVVFGDDIDHYIYQPELKVPYRETAGLEAGVEAVFGLRTSTKTVPESFLVADYNPDLAWEPIQGEASVARQDKTTYGQPYVFGTHHLDADGAKWEAQLRHEAAIAGQVVYEGESNVLEVRPARILRMDRALPDAPNGQVITEVVHAGARDAAYRNTFKSIPSDRRFRLPLDEAGWPRIHGTISARITSPGQYKYAYLTQQGYYTVRFDFDFEDWPGGGECVPLRLAKPFAGAFQTGFHFPLIDGTEAAIAFRDGNPNKPYIAHVHHNSRQTDLITNHDRWLSRNVIRTQSDNKLEFEDWAGQEHVKLSTEHSGKSQLTLGHMVDGKWQARGEGFELRTSGWGAIRGGKGLFLTADDRPRAEGQQLDMREARALLEQAIAQMQSLAESAQQSQAHAADVERQRQFLQRRLDELQQAVLLASAPSGVAVASGNDMLLATEGQLTVTASAGADIGVMRTLTMAAGEAISLFAQKLGMKLFAARGKVELQAQNDEMLLTALKDLKIVSVDGKLILSAEKEVWIGAGGSYTRYTATSIEHGTPGDLREKCAARQRQGKASMRVSSPLTSGLPTQPLVLSATASPASPSTAPVGVPYTVFANGAPVGQGVMDDSGRIAVDHHPGITEYAVRFASGLVQQLPVPDEYSHPENGVLANRGMPRHEKGADGPAETKDSIPHRQRYAELLDPQLPENDQ